MTAEKKYDLLLFAAVPDPQMLEQGFYAGEANGLREHPLVRSVTLTNRLGDVRRAPYDGLIGYFYSYAGIAAGIARLRGKPAILTGGGEQLFRDPMTGWARWGARMLFFQIATVTANRLLATSSTDLVRMRMLAVAGRGRAKLSYHGAAAADRVAQADFVRIRKSGSLVTICGLDTELNVRRKGVIAAVDLLAHLQVAEPDADLMIIGRTTCRGIVEEHAQRLGVADAVHFAGYVSETEKMEILRSRRFYVQLSEYEGFGIGALEALALGCQVIHSNVGGLRDTVGDLGVILSPPDIDRFDAAALAPYPSFDWESFLQHIAQFSVKRRAEAIMTALGLAEVEPGDNVPAVALK